VTANIQQPDRADERVLALAPTGRDGPLAVSALESAGVRAESFSNVRMLCDAAATGAGALIIADEALDDQGLTIVNEILSRQPAWSDLPIILLLRPLPARNMHRTAAALSDSANVTLIERPLSIRTLISAVQTALRARRRQYEVRDHLLELARQEAHLRDAAARERELLRETQAARDRLDLVLFGISDAFFIVDTNWRFTYANGRAARDAGISAGDLHKATIWETFPSLAGHDSEQSLRFAMAERAPVQFEYFVDRMDQWRHCHAYPCPEGLAIFSADITERKNAEEARLEHARRQHHIAETLQQSLQPPPKSFPGVHITSEYQAASREAEIGGDFHDAFRIDETTVALVVGDVVGKGLAAATHTAEVKFALRAMLREDARPGVAMERMNNFLGDAMRLEADAQDQLVAISVAVLNIGTGQLTVAAASAEPPIVLRASGEALPLEARGLVLGAHPKSMYEERSLVLEKGDTIIMLTDGITEARRRSEFFGLEGVLSVVRRCFEQDTLDGIETTIVAEAKAFTGGDLRDDACVLVTRLI